MTYKYIYQCRPWIYSVLHQAYFLLFVPMFFTQYITDHSRLLITAILYFIVYFIGIQLFENVYVLKTDVCRFANLLDNLLVSLKSD